MTHITVLSLEYIHRLLKHVDRSILTIPALVQQCTVYLKLPLPSLIDIYVVGCIFCKASYRSMTLTVGQN